MRDYRQQVAGLRGAAKGLKEINMPRTAKQMEDAADAIEEMLAVCKDVAAFVIHYSDEDNVSAEVLCRKLHKIGLIEKDGAWWTLPAPPKEDAECKK